MISLMRNGGRLSLQALALALGIWGFSGPSAVANDNPPGELYPPQPRDKFLSHRDKHTESSGTLGYGAPGLFPGFQGFGLGYLQGYGYGGQALGPGAEGGYPLFGGPGYPHCDPILRRCGGITAFPYFGGPGYPTPDHPNFFGGVGPLAPDQPVVTIGDDRYDTGYGGFTGAIPYPESVLAPFTTRAAAAGSFSGVSSVNPAAPTANTTPDTGGNANPPVTGRVLGIDDEPVADADGMRGMKITKVYPGSAADKAGLHVGDVIHSINGYRTEQPSNLTRIIANGAPDNVLKIEVRSAADGKIHTIPAQLP